MTDKKRISTARQIILASAIIVSTLLVQNHINRKRSAEYKEIDRSSGINCIVASVLKKKGFSYIDSDTNEKFFLHSSQNRNYKKEYLSENIFVGDSIVKHANSDTIEIYRGTEQYVFIHKQVLK